MMHQNDQHIPVRDKNSVEGQSSPNGERKSFRALNLERLTTPHFFSLFIWLVSLYCAWIQLANVLVPLVEVLRLLVQGGCLRRLSPSSRITSQADVTMTTTTTTRPSRRYSTSLRALVNSSRREDSARSEDCSVPRVSTITTWLEIASLLTSQPPRLTTTVQYTTCSVIHWLRNLD